MAYLYTITGERHVYGALCVGIHSFEGYCTGTTDLSSQPPEICADIQI